MRRILILALFAVPMVACSSAPVADEPVETTPVDADESVSNTDNTETPATSEAAGPPCEQEIALTCPEGQIDGCLKTDPANGATSVTTVHVCIQDLEWASYQTPCSQEIAQECGEGMTDACLLTPAPADVHVCVATP